MKTGIIGAGRVGCSLGKYFRSKNADLVGYYDTNTAAAEEAAAFTQTAGFDQVQQLVRESDILFITTPDSLLVPVWEEIKGMSHRNQIICHCSGALSSDSFSGAKEAGVSCCSVHPMLPFSNKFSSYQQLEHAFLPWKATHMPYRSSPTYSLPMEMKSAGLMPQPSQNIMQLPAS